MGTNFSICKDEKKLFTVKTLNFDLEYQIDTSKSHLKNLYISPESETKSISLNISNISDKTISSKEKTPKLTIKENLEINKSANCTLKRTKQLNLKDLDIEEIEQPEEEEMKNPEPFPVYDQYFLVLPNKEYNFIDDFVHEINKARLNPEKYSSEIKDLIEKIQTDPKTKEQFFMINGQKIYVDSGKVALIECVKYLKNLYIKFKKEKKFLKEIKNIEELKIPFPEDNIENWNNDEFVRNSMRNLMKKSVGKYNLKKFHSMKYVNNPKISAIMSVIDNSDENEKRIRENIFNSEIKYIGMNIKIIDENSCLIYLVFAE